MRKIKPTRVSNLSSVLNTETFKKTELGSPMAYPAFIRLPKPPSHCPLTGLSRSSLNQLILPCEANDFRPRVRSKVLKGKDAVRGIRLIEVQSLLDYLNSLNGEEAAS